MYVKVEQYYILMTNFNDYLSLRVMRRFFFYAQKVWS